jgi:hypothetical protein
VPSRDVLQRELKRAAAAAAHARAGARALAGRAGGGHCEVAALRSGPSASAARMAPMCARQGVGAGPRRDRGREGSALVHGSRAARSVQDGAVDRRSRGLTFIARLRATGLSLLLHSLLGSGEEKTRALARGPAPARARREAAQSQRPASAETRERAETRRGSRKADSSADFRSKAVAISCLSSTSRSLSRASPP